MTQKKQVLCDLQVFFLIFNCQTPGKLAWIIGIIVVVFGGGAAFGVSRKKKKK